MVRQEYIRFMQTLGTDGALNNVRKLANIILAHLDEITPLGTGHGRRVQKLVELAHHEFKTANSECPVGPSTAPSNTSNLLKLKSLSVGPFRGFAKQESFDLDNHIVLIYGPNGSGKSSFCEALEYCLLGSVEEAENKRFKQTHDYLRNAYTGQFAPPVVEAIFANGPPAKIAANEAQFRFCFVEKNRIDNFSRIAANSPTRQTELISTLFGLDSFNDFVRGFSADIDGRYIDLIGKQTIQLAEKKRGLEGEEQLIKRNKEALIQLTAEEQMLADKYKKDMLFSDFVLTLGTTKSPGEIQNIEAELQKPAQKLSGLKHSELVQAKHNVETAFTNLTAKKTELEKYSEGLSYKQLYQAVIELSSASHEICPACKTPISQTVENPFAASKDGLSKLEHLATLEQQHELIKATWLESINNIYKTLKEVCSLIESETEKATLLRHLLAPELSLDSAWWLKFVHHDEQKKSAWDELAHQVTQLEMKDAASALLQNSRQQKTERLSQLRQLYDQVIELQTKRKTLEDGIENASKVIASFDEDNKALVLAVADEKLDVEQNQVIYSAYSQLVSLLNSYNEALPSKLVADLGKLVVTLYNAFNRNDAPNDLLADLKLPTAPGESIKISFVGAPNTYFDALHLLSEGHIRCIGLAILLAKNIKENCPILIFDDPVNAIDDDHREAIRRTLFDDNYFKHKQIILTCHGEEFVKDIQNLLGSQRSKQSMLLTFLPHLDDKHIRIDFNSAPRNYVLAAQEHLHKLEVRGALEKSRQALEGLTKGKIWRYVSKHGDGNLSIKLRSAIAPIELRQLTEQLKTRLESKEFTHTDRKAYLDPITAILGLNGNSREWRYLNKGTHEEENREEFDRGTVTSILNALVALDSAPP